MAGKLYLCATPIGNMEDITFRAVRVLKEADLIAAEDTRHSIKLLNHFDIHTPMTSYHEFNKVEKARRLVQMMLEGKQVACITDAGTPGISDPGEELVRQCHEAGIPVTSVPGPAACVAAVTMSGLPTRRFCFEAFLPTDKKERESVFRQLKTETRTIILYEAPHRLKKTLKELYKELGDRSVTLCRELTKRHEDYKIMNLKDLIQYYEGQEVRGECVLVIEGVSFQELEKEAQDEWKSMSVKEHMDYYLSKGMSKKDAMKKTAKDRGVGKREIYRELLDESEG